MIALSDGLCAGCIRHRRRTLVVAVATLVLKCALLHRAKGFFPVQYTGSEIIGLSEGGPDVSFAAMSERSRRLPTSS